MRIASLLASGVLALVGLGLISGPENFAQSQVLGTAVANTEPDELAFRTPESSIATDFVGQINDLRRERSLDPLTIDAELGITATAWSAQMSQTKRLEHADDLSLGVSVDWRKLGENVGVAPKNQVDELFEAFVTSPTHMANLVDPSFDMVGIGVVQVDGKLWMTQRFMDVSPEAAGVELGQP